MDDSSPAVHAAQLGAWKQIWWQAEDSALWALAGHVWQLVRPLSDGEAEVRKQAAKAREHRLDKERELAQSRRTTVVLDVRRTRLPRALKHRPIIATRQGDETDRIEKALELARAAEAEAANAAVALSPWLASERMDLDVRLPFALR